MVGSTALLLLCFVLIGVTSSDKRLGKTPSCISFATLLLLNGEHTDRNRNRILCRNLSAEYAETARTDKL